MLSVDEARAILLGQVAPLGAEILPVGDCSGRVLAEDMVASRDQPPQRLSAMDGYAVRGEEAVDGARLRLIGDSPAGAPFEGLLSAGTAVRIATGGVVPAGATQVIVQEAVKCSAGAIRLTGPVPAETFIREAGSDFHAGDLLAEAGTLVTPALLGLLAAANHGRVAVCCRPRVAILASGDELRPPGAELAHGQVAESASLALAALARAWGAQVLHCPILPDGVAAARRQLDALDQDADLLVTIGGASVGRRDRLKMLLGERGARLLFEKVAVQPGRPTWHARFSGGPLVLGLPGNPVAAFVGGHLFMRPLLHALAGERGDPFRLVPARLASALPAGNDREMFLRARLSAGDDGRLLVTPDPRRDSSLQAALAAANALLRRAAGAPPAAAGALVEVLPLGPLE